MQRFRRALLWLAYTNILLALNGAGFAIVALALVSMPISLTAIALPFCAIFFVYTFDKLINSDPQDATNDPGRTRLLQRARFVLLVAAFACLIIGATISFSRGWVPGVLFLAPALIGAIYSMPLLPSGFRFRRIKDVTAGKSATVAISWGIGAALLPVSYVGAHHGSLPLLVASWVAARLFINTVFFDIGDLHGDRAQGIRTLPVVLGFRRTRALLLAINIVVGVLTVFMIAAGWLPPIAYAANAVTLYAFVYLLVGDHETDIAFRCDVIADSEGIVAGVLTLAWFAWA